MVKIKETQVTCKACGAVSYYGKQDVVQNFGRQMQNIGKDLTCCGCCSFLPDKDTVDLSKCPKCGSRSITKNTVEHEV